MTDLRVCILIPVYNHPDSIADVCASIAHLALPVLLVDDGCESRCAQVLDGLAAQGHHLLRLPHNQGKGAAVRAGLQHAEQLGFTHALQIDADFRVEYSKGLLVSLKVKLPVKEPKYDYTIYRA